MNNELNQVWQELLGDLSSALVIWQLAVIVVSLLLAWSINGLLRAYVMRHAPETWKIGIGGINRVLFPLTSLAFIYIGQLCLHYWQQHFSLLLLASKLLLAMAAIRLAVYAMRYIFAPGGWVRAMENLISTIVWLILALHLTGLWPDLLQALEDISFKVGKHPVTLLLIIQALITILVTLVIALWISRMLENKLMRTGQINMNVRVVLSKLVRIIFLVLAILMSLSAVGLDITLLSVFGGAVGVGLGFGLQKIASNYVSGFIILLDDSMNIGDVITVEGHYGIVSELRSRYMVLRKLDGTQVVIPHEILISNAVINHSFIDRNARIQMPVQISYESSLELALSVMLEVANRHARVLEDPAPAALIKGFGESGIDLQLSFWIPDPEEGSAALQSEIFLEIWQAFQKNAISIPYPQREIRILAGNDQTKAG
ncbi:MAG: mechanosensitive ion channel domain-containing protein [Candidatus Methylopumilus sp.]|jgi:small-conductance mechanosensitive channel